VYVYVYVYVLREFTLSYSHTCSLSNVDSQFASNWHRAIDHTQQHLITNFDCIQPFFQSYSTLSHVAETQVNFREFLEQAFCRLDVLAVAQSALLHLKRTRLEIQGGPKKNGATLHFPKYLENY